MVGIPLLGKKKAGPVLTAVDRVRGLSNQGFSEPEIIRTLRTEGYSPADVDRSLKMAIRNTASPNMSEFGHELPRPGEPFRGGQNFGSPREFPMPGDPLPDREFPDMGRPPLPEPPKMGGMELPTIPGMQHNPPHHAPRPVGPPSLKSSPLDEELDDEGFRLREPRADIPRLRGHRETKSIEKGEVEEIIEGIIEEKWDLVERELGEFEERMKSLSDKIKTIEDHVNLLKEKRREDQEDIKSSVVAYKEAVGELSMKIDATQNTMKTSLAPMLQTLRSLSDTLKMLKEEKG
ncbi:MAG: hypothetical protein ABIH90_02805 [Candidatus Aenigmatarchaeota archaeon]